MALNFAQTILGVPLESLVEGEQEQDPTYMAGIGLGCLPEHVIAEILRDASVQPLAGSPTTGYKERFERLDYSVTGQHFTYGVMGRFEFELLVLPGPTFELYATVPWRLNVLPGVITPEKEIFANVNATLLDYWIKWSGTGQVALRTRVDGITIPITPRAVPSVPGYEDFAFDVTIYPDSTVDLGYPYEVVWMSNYSWKMRETYSFRPREEDQSKAGRGPHEFGHMMGVPHDIGDRFTVMSTIDDIGFNHWRYSQGRDSNPVLRPWAAHFKLFKVWAETVFAQMGRLEDFIIVLPGQSR